METERKLTTVAAHVDQIDQEEDDNETENTPGNESLTLEDLETSRESSPTASSARTTDSSSPSDHQSDGTQEPEPSAPTRSIQSPRRRTTHLRSYLSASADTVDVNGLLSALLSSLYHRADGASSRGTTGTPAREAAGGYPEDMFHPPLSDELRQQYECSICLQVASEAKECLSGHLFCASCILIWSLSGGAARAKCPVCRSPGKYRPAEKAQQALSGKMVKCLAKGCLWTGQLKRYRAHKIAKHGRDDVQLEGDLDSTTLTGQPAGELGAPSYVMPRLDINTDSQEAQHSRSNSRTGRSYDEMNGNITRGRQRMQDMFASFEQRLVRRRRNIDAAYRERETNRRESLREVETLGRRLDSVSSNIMRLLDNMSGASQRYRRYIREIPTIPDMPSLQLPNHIPNSSRQLREQITTANQNANSRGRSQNPQREPTVTDLSNQKTGDTRSSSTRVSIATRSRGRQSSIYKSTNLVTESRATGPPLITASNTPRVSRNKRTDGASRLTGRSQETSVRLSASHSRQVDRHKFSTRL